MESIYIIGFIQTIFFSLLIFSKERIRLSDIFLVSFIMIMGLRLLGIYLNKSGILNTYPVLLLPKYIYWPLLGPQLYLYISVITARTQSFKKTYLLHYIPSLIILLIILIHTNFLKDYEPGRFTYPGVIYKTGMFIWFLISFIYYLISIIKLQQFKKEIKDYFSSLKDIDLRWLRNLTLGFGLFLLLSFTFIICREVLDIDIAGLWEHITWVIITLYIFGIGYFGYKQRSIFSHLDEEVRSYEKPDPEKVIPLKEAKEKYIKTKIDKSEADNISNVLLNYMDNEKPYLESQLNLISLANSLNTSSYKLSQVINTRFEKNFFEFVNEYRIKHAVKLLKDPDYNQEKIMSIAYDCGFNSKSSFFSVFKKIMAQTPSEFRQNNTI